MPGIDSEISTDGTGNPGTLGNDGIDGIEGREKPGMPGIAIDSVGTVNPHPIRMPQPSL